MRRLAWLLVIVMLAAGLVALSSCSPAAEEPPDQQGEEPFTPPEGALVSAPVGETTPTIDGTADDAVWQDAQPLEISVTGGANASATTVTMKSVYTDDTVFFVATWADPTQSFLRSPWEKQADGTWTQLKDPADKGGDNNVWYEDKFALLWPINDSIPDFDTQGCSVTCHAGENPDIKPYGNKYTAAEDQTGDIWHWKSVRNLGQIDDQYLDSTKLDPQNLDKTREAGRHSDTSTAGGYRDNKSSEGSRPQYMLPAGSSKDGAPGFILDSEKVAFDDSLFAAGDRVPSIVIAQFEGDRADISAAWKWANGTWTLEFARALETGGETDVEFNDLDKTYYFGLAIFDNAQVRHAVSGGALPFVFQP